MEITVKSLTGDCYHVQVSHTATGLDVKKAIQDQDPNLPPHLQRLVGPNSTKINDDSRLSECRIENNAVLNLIVLSPFEIYVQGINGKNRTIYVDNEMCTVSALRELIGNAFGHNMRGYQLYHLGRPVDETLQKTVMKLKDFSIKPGSTLVVTKMGLTLNVTNAKIDVCFLVDCTGSMNPYITAVKNNIRSLRDKIQEEYQHSDVVFSFVRYTDYDQHESTRTSYLQFTDDPNIFREFVGAIIAYGGGGDGPEDVMGGFKVTFGNLKWRSDSCKILIHIADYPCHGNQYHSFGNSDFFPKGDPAGLTHERVMEDILRFDIQYYFGYIIRHNTDQMIEVFNDYLETISEQRLIIRQFDAMNCDEIGEAVQRSVIASVYGKAALKARDYTIVNEIPDWNSPLIFEETGKKTPAPKLVALSELDSSAELQKPSIDFEFKIASNPFVEGSESYVYYASDLVDFRRIVLKVLKDGDSLENYMKKLEYRVLSTAYARAFSEEKLKPQSTCSVDFVQLDIIDSSEMFYMLEPFLKGKITKTDENCTRTYFDLLEAFSHYTWVKSGKTLLITGLQGFKKKLQDKIVCTDPTIFSNSESGKYGPMDSGMEGIKRFFESHTCSEICVQMKLSGQSA